VCQDLLPIAVFSKAAPEHKHDKLLFKQTPPTPRGGAWQAQGASLARKWLRRVELQGREDGVGLPKHPISSLSRTATSRQAYPSMS
jgi:hypothetical protein